MPVKRKKPGKARKRVAVKAKKTAAAPAGLRTLDAGWQSFIGKAASDTPLTKAWGDPKTAAARPRKAAPKKSAKKKAAPKKPATKSKKKAARPAARK